MVFEPTTGTTLADVIGTMMIYTTDIYTVEWFTLK